MRPAINELGQPIGFALPHYQAPKVPNFSALDGKAASLVSMDERHLPALYKAFSYDSDGGNWTYLPYGPFLGEAQFVHWAKTFCFGEEPKFYIISLAGEPAGLASFLSIKPGCGSIEIGHIHLSPLLQQTRAGTEALILMIQWAFTNGYRRLEWKCDALNAPSRRSALRLGLSYEGVFRQATIYKYRSRDTAWYAAIDSEWPALAKAYEHWLAPANFSLENRAIKRLSELTAPILVIRG